MKILFVSNLFPNTAEPTRGLDNARLLAELARHAEVRALALRPTRGVPPLWWPKPFACREEDRRFSPVFCPVAYVPKFGSALNHRLMAWTMRETLGSVRREFPFDVVLCAWVYPDGCAVAELAARCDFPFVVIAQGSDVHQYLKMPARRKIIPPALNRARGVITRSGELARLLAGAGVSPEKLHTIYNGVDFDRFHPADRSEARAELGLPPGAPVVLYVGNLFAIKNPLLLVAAHAELNRRRPQNPFHLVMLGDGSLRRDVERALRDSATAHLARLPGRQPPERVAHYMQAADLLCVPSDNEGVPNVILEAFACGLPVVSTNVGGIGEVLREGFLGRLVAPRDLPALVAALGDLLVAPVAREKIAAHARQFSWEQTASECLRVLSP